MFIQKAYESRIKKEHDDEILPTLVPKHEFNPIGSIRNHRINYDRDEEFFAIDDIPPHKKAIHDEIKEIVDPDILGLRQTAWNSSVLVPKNPQLEEPFERKLIKVIPLTLFRFVLDLLQILSKNIVQTKFFQELNLETNI